MTVYVDDMRAPFGRMIMCHMIADSDAELHAMAARIGIARRWFQRDHYDVSEGKRALAVQFGAREIAWREAGRMTLERRRAQAEQIRAASAATRAERAGPAAHPSVQAVLLRFPGAVIVGVRQWGGVHA